MTSYSIDASVYAYPFQQMPSDPNEPFNYCKAINDLCDVVNKKQPRNKKYYFFLRDMKFIIKNKELNYIIQDISPLDQLLKENNIKANLLRDAQDNLGMFFDRFLFKLKKEDKLPEKVIFENWFNIGNVIFKDNNIFPLPDEVSKIIKNKDLKKNIVKNLAKIAFLNKYVYNNNDKIHNIVLGGGISATSIPIPYTEFEIKKAIDSFENKGVTYTYIFKDAPQKDIQIKNQNINVSPLDTLVSDDLNYLPGEWGKALSKAENDLKHLKFGPEVRTSLKQYAKKIEEEKNKLPVSDELEKWIKEGPDSLYENLKALNTFVSTANLCSFSKNLNERYLCNENCEFIESCSSNLRFFGVDCGDESRGIKEDSKSLDQFNFVEADRTIKNSEAGYSTYWMHLKPRSAKCYKPLWFLTLRIHFRLLESYMAPKVEIGWIGRHLYHPCDKKEINECNKYGRGINCPRHPLCPLDPPYDPKKDELTNYRRQWPEPEPESEPSKAEESEKSPTVLPENH